MMRHAQVLLFTVLLLGTVAFRINSPSGDIQPYGTSGGPVNANSVVLPSATLDGFGNAIPTNPNTSTIYVSQEYLELRDAIPANYMGAANFNISIGFANGAPTFTGMTPNQQGVIYAWTTTTTQGGSIGGLAPINIVKSTTINYQWRVYFMMPNLLSTAANRYVAYIGGQYLNGSANFAGPFISYSDNVNSGNWVLTSVLNYNGGTTISTNTAIAVPAPATWHTLVITLVNGTYTYLLDGVSLGTVVDTNMSTTLAAPVAAGGSIYIQPNTAWTTSVYLAIDRSDFLVTGLAR